MTGLIAVAVIGTILAVAFGLDLIRHQRLLAAAQKDVDALRLQIGTTLETKERTIAYLENEVSLRVLERDHFKAQAQVFRDGYDELRELYRTTFELWDEDAAVVDQARRRRVN